MQTEQNINPGYYKMSGVSLAAVIADWTLGFHLGCILKYVCRAGKKVGPVETVTDATERDLLKAMQFVKMAIEVLGKSPKVPLRYDNRNGAVDYKEVAFLWADGWQSGRGEIIQLIHGISPLENERAKADLELMLDLLGAEIANNRKAEKEIGNEAT